MRVLNSNGASGCAANLDTEIIYKFFLSFEILQCRRSKVKLLDQTESSSPCLME